MSSRRDLGGLFFHRAFGVTLASTHAIPGLRRVGPASAGVHVRWLGSQGDAAPPRRGRPWRVHPFCDATGRPLLTVHRDAERGYQLLYADGTRFRVGSEGRHIDVHWPAHYALEDAACYLTGPVLGFARRLQGATTLHAAAVVIRGEAVALLGTSGAGKSTLTAALARRGHGVLCDDAACLDLAPEQVRVEPGATRVRMWDDAAAFLLGDARQVPRTCPSWSKRALDLLEAGAYAEHAAPLATLLLLDPPSERTRAGLGSPLPPPEALVALAAHGYGALMQDAAMRASEFARLARVAERVAVRRLARGPEGLQGLDATCEAVEQAAREAPGAQAGALRTAAGGAA